MTTMTESQVTPLTDWIASSDRDPPGGELMFECHVGHRTFLCQRSDYNDGDGAFWESEGAYVPRVLKWRVITGQLDHQTKSEWAAKSSVRSDPARV